MIPMITAYLLMRQFFVQHKIEQKITIVMPILTVVGVDLVYEHHEHGMSLSINLIVLRL